jgi:hypothetical protein
MLISILETTCHIPMLRYTPMSYATPQWATPHPNELSHTKTSYATHQWATPQHKELRHTTHTPMRYATHHCATPHSYEFRHTPISYATLKWATSHMNYATPQGATPTTMSYATPQWTTPHPNALSHTSTKLSQWTMTWPLYLIFIVFCNNYILTSIYKISNCTKILRFKINYQYIWEKTNTYSPPPHTHKERCRKKS